MKKGMDFEEMKRNGKKKLKGLNGILGMVVMVI